ncbi:hypothetical protein FOA43_001973 [Brettanomyces nanus]|uniref:Zn(2)-C6 fungal-type domain-containing protein n=1 Tax=Eeniella nana TaxID=13502 RepID=A0A875RYN2_EENNA|nr:uncharacterized protein FOA43_001968 [Brettanomyces nanus]XP_038778206.1 uncharacterized protein FOA43_001973 [Brettanomyces nanus]QPG74636.1 hypothetical protein FOA43_001968 [Brettanomyces nanus]QPG74641.1 hypothetical protein FOA43_001973 [Brettanomyces nanus]
MSSRSLNSHQKLSKSCDVCRAKKLKCDSGQDCGYCRKHGLVCVYSLVSKPGLKPGYGKDVLRRLTQLEDQSRVYEQRLRAMELQLSQPQMQQQLSQAPKQPIQPQQQQQLMPSESSQQLTLQMTHTVQVQQPPTQIDIKDPPFYDGLPRISTVRRLIDIFFVRVFSVFPIVHPHYTKAKIERYIKHVLSHPQGPTKEPPVVSFAIILNALQYTSPDLDIKLTAAEKDDLINKCKEKIILECYAISSIPQLQAITLMAFHRVANGSGTESWSVIGIAATGVISLNMSDIRQRIPTLPSSYRDGHSPASTGSVSSTNTKVIRTKRAKILKEPVDWLDEEDRRRLVWGIAILDVFSSFASGTPLRIPNSEIQFSAPFSTTAWLESRRSNGALFPSGSDKDGQDFYDAFSYYTQIIKIFRGVHSFLAQPRDISDKGAVGEWFVSFHQIETDIREWKDRLPLKYKLLLNSNVLDIRGSGAELSSMVLLHSAYNIALIKMHSAYGYPHLESYAFKHSELSRKICTSSVDSISALAKQIMEYESENGVKLLEYLGPHYGFNIWVCSRLLIADSIFSQKDGKTIDKNSMNIKLKLFCNILQGVGNYCPAIQKYNKILRQLINLNISVSSAVSDTSPNDAESEEDDDKMAPSQAIADMRINTDLLSLILANKLAVLEGQSTTTHPPSASQSTLDLQGMATKYILSDANQQESMPLEAFQFDASSYGFEDLFGYLDNNISQQ